MIVFVCHTIDIHRLRTTFSSQVALAGFLYWLPFSPIVPVCTPNFVTIQVYSHAVIYNGSTNRVERLALCLVYRFGFFSLYRQRMK